MKQTAEEWKKTNRRKKEKKKKGSARNFGFTILDFMLVALALACVVSVAFREQIRGMLGERTEVGIEYTFVIKNVTESANNHPSEGEIMMDMNLSKQIGTILAIDEKAVLFRNLEDGELDIYTLTCRASGTAEEGPTGFTVSGVEIKPGAEILAETPSSSFRMTVISVKVVETQ